ncbi:MAG: hypothetical protein ACUVS3_09070 [Thermodesulfobacteriota bacterium]
MNSIPVLTVRFDYPLEDARSPHRCQPDPSWKIFELEGGTLVHFAWDTETVRAAAQLA